MTTAVATIITCDPTTRKLEGVIKDGVPIPIIVWEIPGVFVWPKIGEQWTVTRSIGVWKLGQRIEPLEGHSIQDIEPGEGKIAADALYDSQGRRFANTDDLSALEELATDLTTPEAVHYVGADGEPAFQNSWENFDPNPGPTGRDLFFYRLHGRVYIEGVIKSGTSGTVVFELPEGYRPLPQTNTPVNCVIPCSGGLGVLGVRVNGEVFVSNAVNGISTTANVSTYSLISNVNFRHA